MDLKELAEKYKTDKLEHGYIKYYEKYLPENPSSLLEFGCYKGASVRMWKEHYPDSEIATFDLFKEFDIRTELLSNGIYCFQGDVSYYDDLQKIDCYDIIIDDASHNSYDQIFAFVNTFLKNLNQHGIYVIEDLHCCMDPFYWNRGIAKFEETILYAFQNWTKEDGLKLEGLITQTMFNDYIKDIKLHDNKIAFIFKK